LWHSPLLKNKRSQQPTANQNPKQIAKDVVEVYENGLLQQIEKETDTKPNPAKNINRQA
jgi:hypothetical protein